MQLSVGTSPLRQPIAQHEPALEERKRMKVQVQRRLRQYHNWLGLFFAPAIIFFALSGVLQILDLHEDAPGYEAPAWVKPLASIHKHGEVSRQAKPKAKPPATGAMDQKPAPDWVGKAEGFKLTQFFVALLGLVLAASSILGIWIAFANKNARKRSSLLLLAGILVPILLLAI